MNENIEEDREYSPNKSSSSTCSSSSSLISFSSSNQSQLTPLPPPPTPIMSFQQQNQPQQTQPQSTIPLYQVQQSPTEMLGSLDSSNNGSNDASSRNLSSPGMTTITSSLMIEGPNGECWPNSLVRPISRFSMVNRRECKVN
jgi:hypothetical protein